MPSSAKTADRRLGAAFKAMAVLTVALLGSAAGVRSARVAWAAPPGQITALDAIAQRAMAQYHLKSLIVQVRSGGKVVYSRALGYSMTGVRATPAMHFRNGAMAFTYLSTMLLELVDRKQVKLEDKLSKFYPGLPHSDRITLENLADMTSGYADYVYQPEVLRGTELDPFRQWTSEQLIRIGITKPMMFSPGTNWGYSHTNYVILGRVLEKITHMPLDVALQKYIFSPMHLRETRGSATPAIPEPFVHSFTSERRSALGLKTDVSFYEESTFWNPSWTTAEGAVETSDIGDMNASMEAIGNGTLVSRRARAKQVEPHLIGFGHRDPRCSACRKNIVSFNYGLGVVIIGPWITQTKSFAGAAASVGFLHANDLAIAVATTLAPEAFDAEGNAATVSIPIFAALAGALAPKTLPSPSP